MQSTRGVVYQWTFVLSQQAQESITANGTTCFDPYQGPLCCVTLRASTSTDLPWPDRADCPTPSVVAELILMSGGNLAYDDLPGLRKAVFEAIQAFFCPCDQKVWYDVCLFLYIIMHDSKKTVISLQDICYQQADYRRRKILWWSRWQ